MSKTNENQNIINDTNQQADQIIYLPNGNGGFFHTHTTVLGALKDFTGECNVPDIPPSS